MSTVVTYSKNVVITTINRCEEGVLALLLTAVIARKPGAGIFAFCLYYQAIHSLIQVRGYITETIDNIVLHEFLHVEITTIYIE